MSGALVAYLLIWLGFDFWNSFGIGIGIGVLWELFEKVTALSSTEFATNSLTDILFAQAGFLTSWYAWHMLAPGDAKAVAWAVLVFFGICVVLGWISFTYYRSVG